jgi:hypothetical protein
MRTYFQKNSMNMIKCEYFHYYREELVKLSRSLNNNTQQKFLKHVLAATMLIIVLIIIYMGGQKNKMNFENFSAQTSVSQKRFDIVLSYFSEDVTYVARFIQYIRNVSTVQKLKPRTIVYNKNKQVNSKYLKEVLKADIVHSLPNLGREGATYLYHIIENYHTLANHTIFSQAGVEGITNTSLDGWLLHRLEKQFNSTVGYMPLVADNWFTTFDCGVRPGENMLRLPEFWGIIEQTICPPGGQFVSVDYNIVYCIIE